MKNNFLQLAITILLLMIVIVTCKKEKEEDKVTSTISEATEIAESCATFDVSVTSNANVTDKGICYSSQNDMPTTGDSKISKGSGAESYSVILTGLTENTKYYVCPYAIVNGETYYGERRIFTTLQEKGVLINGVCWATRNVDMPGTFAAKPEDAGMFYLWNSKIGWSTTDPRVSSDGDTTLYYVESDGVTWEKTNDPCPAGWRVPTSEVIQSLIDADSQWATVNNVTGRIFGSGDQTLFLPAVGYRNYDVEQVGAHGFYWSGSRNLHFPDALHINSSNAHMGIHDFDYLGYSVRCVKE